MINRYGILKITIYYKFENYIVIRVFILYIYIYINGAFCVVQVGSCLTFVADSKYLKNNICVNRCLTKMELY